MAGDEWDLPRAGAAAWPRASKTPIRRSERGTPLSVHKASSMVHDLLGSCAVRNLVLADAAPHRVRHTFGTCYLSTHSHDQVGLAHLLGHNAVDTTWIYVRPREEELAARVDRIDLKVFDH
jgi:site-specific recombinase XerC